MTSATRREALEVLAELCELAPDVRLGQLCAHLGLLGEDQTGRTLWDIDDEQFLDVLYRHRKELSERSPDPRPPSLPSSIGPTPTVSPPTLGPPSNSAGS